VLRDRSTAIVTKRFECDGSTVSAVTLGRAWSGAFGAAGLDASDTTDCRGSEDIHFTRTTSTSERYVRQFTLLPDADRAIALYKGDRLAGCATGDVNSGCESSTTCACECVFASVHPCSGGLAPEGAARVCRCDREIVAGSDTRCTFETRHTALELDTRASGVLDRKDDLCRLAACDRRWADPNVNSAANAEDAVTTPSAQSAANSTAAHFRLRDIFHSLVGLPGPASAISAGWLVGRCCPTPKRRVIPCQIALTLSAVAAANSCAWEKNPQEITGIGCRRARIGAMRRLAMELEQAVAWVRRCSPKRSLSLMDAAV
jgi:hypothetical protein